MVCFRGEELDYQSSGRRRGNCRRPDGSRLMARQPSFRFVPCEYQSAGNCRNGAATRKYRVETSSKLIGLGDQFYAKLDPASMRCPQLIAAVRRLVRRPPLPHCTGTDPRLEAPSGNCVAEPRRVSLRYAPKPYRALDESPQCVALGVERLRRRAQRTVMNFRVGLRWHRHANSALCMIG
jgi:hypothetical protein